MDPIYPIDQQIINVVRSINSGYLQTFKYLGITPYKVLKNTTLNEKFGVLADVMPAGNQIPNTRYLVIGNKGHRSIRAADGSDESENIIHRTNHSALYGHIPFVTRPIENDITALERERYGLRTLETINGKPHVNYWARRYDVTLIKPQLIEITVINGIPTVKPYIPSVADLNPTQPEITNNGTVIGSNENISSSAIVTINLSPWEINEIVNAHRIRTNSTRTPTISEIGICSGVDRMADGQSTAGSFQYNEIVACQINVFIATNHPVGYNSSGLELKLDIGNTEPTLGTQSVNQATIIP